LEAKYGASGGIASSDTTLALKLDKKDYLIEPVYSAVAVSS
jgi:hypothetical protein